MSRTTRHPTAFYVEALLMTLSILLVSAVLFNIFFIAKQKSRQARMLSDAVAIASNIAETAADAKSEEALADALGAAPQQNGGSCCIVQCYDEFAQGTDDGAYSAEVLLTESSENLMSCEISVYAADSGELLYTLHTLVHQEGAA